MLGGVSNFYKLPFCTTGTFQEDFPEGHSQEVEFISYESNLPESFVIGGNPGTFFAHEDRVHTMTIQIVGMGQEPLSADFDVWLDKEELHVKKKGLVTIGG